MRARHGAFVLGVIVAGGLAAQVAHANLEAFVESGDRVSGDLRSGGETDTYRLTGAAGDVMEAVVRANRTVTVRLRDVNGSVLAQQSGRNVHLVSSALSAAGAVSVEIVGASSPAGKSRYTATLTCGDETSDRKLDLREAAIGAGTTSVEADLVAAEGGVIAAENVAGIASASATLGSGVVRRDTPFVIGAAAGISVPNGTAVGAAVLFGPLPRSFRIGSDVQMVLPYDPSQVQAAPQVFVSDLAGRTSVVRNVTVDAPNSVVRFAASRFGIYQVFDGTGALGPLSGASLTTSDAAALDTMTTVAMKNGRLVVGVPSHLETIGGETENHGAVYVYELSGSSWTEVAKLQPTDLSLVAGFGTAVAIDGDRIVASAVGSRTGVWVFDRVGGAWTETKEILGGYTFGTSVALQGDRMAVGNPMFRGSVVVYDFDGTDWNEDGTISPGPAAFGQTVALNGDNVVIGSPSESPPGAVYSYLRVAGQWVEEDRIPGPSTSTFPLFGAALSLEGDRLAVGAWARSSATAVGSVSVFERTSGLWTEKARIDNPNGAHNDHFGAALALSGDRLLIGAPLSNVIAEEGGITYLATRGSGNWSSVKPVVPPGVGVGDHLGLAVALDGALSAIVAGGEDDAATNAGVVHILDVTNR